jgi:hypothetical protein
MIEEIESHIEAVQALYRPVIALAGGRLAGGEQLYCQFEQAVDSFRRHGRGRVSGVVERVNELAVARKLLMDPSLEPALIEYEPEVLADGPKFDFALRESGDRTVYVEVKTVEPRTEDDNRNRQKVLRRQQHVSPGNQYVVAKEWMGAAIFGNSFSARSSFMAYTLETEAKLSAQVAARPGRGVLVFCGTGFAWHVSELEDFADFYSRGRHRVDDPFATMEQHAMRERGIKLARTLDGFAALHRHHDATEPSEWIYPVRGPRWG